MKIGAAEARSAAGARALGAPLGERDRPAVRLVLAEAERLFLSMPGG